MKNLSFFVLTGLFSINIGFSSTVGGFGGGGSRPTAYFGDGGGPRSLAYFGMEGREWGNLAFPSEGTGGGAGGGRMSAYSLDGGANSIFSGPTFNERNFENNINLEDINFNRHRSLNLNLVDSQYDPEISFFGRF